MRIEEQNKRKIEIVRNRLSQVVEARRANNLDTLPSNWPQIERRVVIEVFGCRDERTIQKYLQIVEEELPRSENVTKIEVFV